MGDVIYRKYRPKNFNEVIGQDHIISVLKEQVKSLNYGHAYLFTGSRGTGKTTVARIFAAEINGKKENDSDELDIIEIDAASNRGIDDIRELRDKISYAPSKAKYKVYIIDEVHMLTKEAFNALLKTLEEPPKHVIFIFATTEPHKIPITILSRVMRFDFKLASEKSLGKKFEYIFKKEKIEFDNEIIELLIRYSNGSFRDGESLINKLISGVKGNKLTVDTFNNVVGFVDKVVISEFIKYFNTNNTLEIIKLVRNLKKEGRNLDIIVSQLIIELEKIMIDLLNKKNSIFKNFTITSIAHIINELSKVLNDSKSDIIHGLSLELALIRICEKGDNNLKLEINDTEKSNKESGVLVSLHERKNMSQKRVGSIKQIMPESAKPENGNGGLKYNILDLNNIEKSWKDLVKRIAEEHYQLAAVLINSKLVIQGNDIIIIEVPYTYYKTKLETNVNKVIINKCLANELGIENLNVIIKHNKNLQKKDGSDKKEQIDTNKDIVEDIFNM